MDEIQALVEEEPTEDLQDQLNIAKEEIQSLTQQLNCLLVLTKNAWRGDEAATVHLARVIGIDHDVEQNSFTEKKIIAHTTAKKTVKIADNEEIVSKQTPSIASSTSHEDLRQPQPHIQAAMRNTYLQPFFKQSHIDPIRGQNSSQIFNNMVRHHQNAIRKPPVLANRNNLSATVRPRATKHLYRPASADHVVRHLGSPISRTKPYFVFAGREFFRQTTNYSPLYQRAVVTSSESRQSHHSDISDESEIVASPAAEPVFSRPQTAKSTQQSSTLRFGSRSASSDVPGRASSAFSNASSTKLSQLSERERRDAMLLQRKLNLPRQGWINQHS